MKLDWEKDFQEGVNNVRNVLEQVGQEAVEDARATGNYHNRTGHLRRSNYYKVTVTDDRAELEIGNSASYAGDMESRGFEVVTGAALRAYNKLKDNDYTI